MSSEDRAFIAAAVASTLYLGCVFAGGIVLHSKAAWIAALISIACCYLMAMAVQAEGSAPLLRIVIVWLFGVSIVSAGTAGLCLLIGG